MQVDRILNARQAEREQRDQAAREVRLQAERRSANALVRSLPFFLSCTSPLNQNKQDPTQAAAYEKQLQDLFPDASPTYLRQLLAAQTTSHVENAANTLLTTDYPRRPIEPPAVPTRNGSSGGSSYGGKDSEKSGSFFGDIKKKFKSESSSRLSPTPTTETRSPSQHQVGPPRLPPNLAPPRQAVSTPTNTDAIRSNVRKAVAVSSHARPRSQPDSDFARSNRDLIPPPTSRVKSRRRKSRNHRIRTVIQQRVKISSLLRT